MVYKVRHNNSAAFDRWQIEEYQAQSDAWSRSVENAAEERRLKRQRTRNKNKVRGGASSRQNLPGELGVSNSNIDDTAKHDLSALNIESPEKEKVRKAKANMSNKKQKKREQERQQRLDRLQDRLEKMMQKNMKMEAQITDDRDATEGRVASSTSTHGDANYDVQDRT